MDVSDKVDLLLGGVVPERMEELASSWGLGPDRVRLTAGPGFDIGQRFGCILITQPFLDLMWLTGAGVWAGIKATAGFFVNLECSGLPFSPSEMRHLEGQMASDDQFDRIIEKAKEMGSIANPGDFQWPVEVPQPQVGARQGSSDWQATFDLILMAGGYAFLHEIRHCQIEKEGHTLGPVDEERACDTYARGMMLDKVRDYCATTSYPEEMVRAKRIMGILFAKLVILTVTPRPLWSNSHNHPTVKERISTVLKAATAPTPDWFWPTVAGMFAAFARYNNLFTGAFETMSSRDLAFAICNLFDDK